MKKIVAVFLVLVTVLAVFASCGDSEKNTASDNGVKSQFAGYWNGDFSDGHIVMYFEDNGTGKLYYIISDEEAYFQSFDWQDKGEGKVNLAYSGEEGYEATYSFSGDVLTFDGQELVRCTEDEVPKNAEDLKELEAFFN